MPFPSPPVTEDALIKHRLEALERLGEGWIEAQRRMDALALSQASIERSVGAIEASLEKSAMTMIRLHERLDDAMTEKAREEGREEGRAQARSLVEAEAREAGRREGREESRRSMWKVVGATAPIAIAFTVMVFIVLNFALNG